MNITFKPADNSDIETVYLLSKDLIDRYENIENINYDMVLNWIKDKINKSINEYASVYLDDKKCGYYHFCRNEEGILEIDDLYIFKEYQNKGIGTYVINNILITINEPVMLYVFIGNEKAVSLYKRLGFRIIRNIKVSRYIMEKAI
ncbi:MAG: GNAT family N-acetyltransferase [Solobacterium sp.]|nr:GNAT family N-acetyltransferase [Solobacterium sp.]